MNDISEKQTKLRKTLEERDREDQKLFGWKGGVVSQYKEYIDIDEYTDDLDETPE